MINKANNGTTSSHTYHMRKCLIVNSILLAIAFGDKPSFVSFKIAINLEIRAVNSFCIEFKKGLKQHLYKI